MQEIIILTCPKCREESEYITRESFVGEKLDVECECGYSFVAKIGVAVFYAVAFNES